MFEFLAAAPAGVGVQRTDELALTSVRPSNSTTGILPSFLAAIFIAI